MIPLNEFFKWIDGKEFEHSFILWMREIYKDKGHCSDTFTVNAYVDNKPPIVRC